MLNETVYVNYCFKVAYDINLILSISSFHFCGRLFDLMIDMSKLKI